jgi:hypothetical protein
MLLGVDHSIIDAILHYTPLRYIKNPRKVIILVEHALFMIYK